MLWIEGELLTPMPEGDDKIHLWILTCLMGDKFITWSLYDGDKLIINHEKPSSKYLLLGEASLPSWQYIILGLPELYKLETGVGYVYECMGFNKALDSTEINNIKLFLKKYYKYN